MKGLFVCVFIITPILSVIYKVWDKFEEENKSSIYF